MKFLKIVYGTNSQNLVQEPFLENSKMAFFLRFKIFFFFGDKHVNKTNSSLNCYKPSISCCEGVINAKFSSLKMKQLKFNVGYYLSPFHVLERLIAASVKQILKDNTFVLTSINGHISLILNPHYIKFVSINLFRNHKYLLSNKISSTQKFILVLKNMAKYQLIFFKRIKT